MKNGSLLPWIVAFKAIKTVLLTALGVALIFSIKRDPVSLVWRAAEAVQGNDGPPIQRREHLGPL